MPATIAVRELHPDLPIERAWRMGRRIYLRCGQHSVLSQRLHQLGAKWDVRERSLWVGSGKADRVLEAALDHQVRRSWASAVRAADLWVQIPFEAELIRARAKDAGAVWDEGRKQWAAPDLVTQAELGDLVGVWQQARDAEDRRRRERAEAAWRRARELAEIARREAAVEARLRAAGEREAARRRAVEQARSQREALAAAAGRTLTGQVEQRSELFPIYTRRVDAEATLAQVGQVLRLPDGRRALVTRAAVRWVAGDDARAAGQDHDHLRAEHTLAIVAPTETELDAETARGAAALDAAEAAALADEVFLACLPVTVDAWIPLHEFEGRLVVTTGVNGQVAAARLTLTRDGVVWWQDQGRGDYVQSEGSSGDPALVAWFRTVLSGGDRTVVQSGDPPVHYRIQAGAR